jgi:putative acetyltransferase
MDLPAELAFERVTAPTPDFVALLDALDRDLTGPYAPEQRHALPLDRLFQPQIRIFLARLRGAAVACGGIAFLEGYAELKRMYAAPAVRGTGVARALLQHLEAEARDGGASLLRIETGRHQLAALKFYVRAGYRACGPFGPYAEMPPKAIETSLFYEKSIPRD